MVQGRKTMTNCWQGIGQPSEKQMEAFSLLYDWTKLTQISFKLVKKKMHYNAVCWLYSYLAVGKPVLILVSMIAYFFSSMRSEHYLSKWEDDSTLHKDAELESHHWI